MAGRKAGEPRKDKARPEVDGLPAKAPGPEPWAPSAEQAEQIKSLAARGVAEKEIAILIGVDRDTLKSRAQALIDAGRAVGISTLTGVLFREAQKGSYKHLALYLQHVGKWSQRQTVEHTGEGGGPVQYTILTGVPLPEDEAE